MCFIWCMSYTVGMSIICFLNIALSCFTLFKQVPDFLNWDSANGFISKNKPSSRLIYGMAAAHVLCIVLSLFWFVKTVLVDSDSLWTRQIMIVVQWLYVFANFVLALLMDKGGLGAVVFDGVLVIPCVIYANFLK